MEDNLSYYEKCLILFRGEASQELEKEVLDAKNSDPESLQIFQETQLIFEGFRVQKGYAEAKKLFQKDSQNRLILFRMALAASVILIALFSYLGVNKTYFPDFQTQSSVLMSPEIVDQGDDNTPQANAYQLFVEGKGLYDAQEFDKAMLKFEESIAQPNLRNQLREAIQWHQCVTYMRAGEIDNAKTLFTALEKIENPKFKVGLLSKLKIRFQLFLKSLF